MIGPMSYLIQGRRPAGVDLVGSGRPGCAGVVEPSLQFPGVGRSPPSASDYYLTGEVSLADHMTVEEPGR